MIRFTAHFDGQHLSPDEPVELPTGKPLQVTVEEVAPEVTGNTFDLGTWLQEIEGRLGLIDRPADWAAEHDRYLPDQF